MKTAMIRKNPLVAFFLRPTQEETEEKVEKEAEDRDFRNTLLFQIIATAVALGAAVAATRGIFMTLNRGFHI